MARRSLACCAVAITSCALPLLALAAPRITEIMYDPPGANAGHQWIQIVNLGNSPEDLSGYKLFQNGVNHSISVITGTTTLAAGQVAIIANNPATFQSDYPGYAGVLFKASFSLRVSGDSAVLKDAKSQMVDAAAYSSSQGASSDGNALYLVNGTWKPGAPDPNVYHATPPAALVAKAPDIPPAAKASASSHAKPASKTSSKPPSGKTVASADTRDAAGGGNLAAPAATQSSTSLVEIIAGSAAFGIVVVAGIVLSNRFAPQPQPAPAAAEPQPAAKKPSEADEYKISEVPSDFI